MRKKKSKAKNPVAKHMETFNRPQTHVDRKKEYKKGKSKHKAGQKDWPYFLVGV